MRKNVKQALALAIVTITSVLFVLYALKQKAESDLIITRLEIQLEECKMEAEKQKEVALMAQKEAKAQAALANKIMEDKLNMETLLNNKK